MSKPARISNPDFAKAVAQAYIDGCSREEMADMFGVHKDTITVWTKDPRVQAHAAKFAQERVNRITRRIDRTIEGRLEHADKMEVETLLKIRREFLDRALKVDLGAGQTHSETVNETVEALQSNPEMAEQLKALLGVDSEPK